ncbi:MAG: hypothetical protein MUF18_12610 [Fimbriiglobus sp.]|nr:hypothetical protein [Fimbriiglobus sp.]
MSFGFDYPQPVYVSPSPRSVEVVASPAPVRRPTPVPAPRPVERPREPEVVRVNLPGPEELGIRLGEAWELPSPDELGIDPR